MQLAHVKELEKKYLLGTYSRYELLADRGTGAYLIDKSNKRYLDLLAGIAVNALGYNHPRIKQVLRKQIKKPIHVSNLIYHEYQGRLAEKLCNISGLDRAFFTNSGTESIEACLKFARAYARPKFRVLSLDESFHGRTFGALSATGQKQYREQFAPATEKELLPDMIALAKPLGLGIPLGAVILNERVAAAIQAGQHGTTFGGGPLACRASLEYFNVLEDENLLEQVRKTGAHFKQRLEEMKDLPVVKEVRGEGLMLAVELKISGKDIVKQLLQQGFILNCTHETVLRMLPPFIITEKQIDKFVRALRPVLEAQHV